MLARTQQIEIQLGRTKKAAGYEARPIDIDLLYYDAQILLTEELQLPHPRIAARKFVLVPLAEVAPDFRDPVTGKSVLEMLAGCEDASTVSKIS